MTVTGYIFLNDILCYMFTPPEKRLEDPQAHVVREEEGSGNKEQSELVTSSSNSLANLKRRLESLRNRHGGKQRRLENSSRGASSSAVGWPVENNVAVSSLQFDHANPAGKLDEKFIIGQFC